MSSIVRRTRARAGIMLCSLLLLAVGASCAKPPSQPAEIREGPRASPAVPLYENLGTLHFPIRTKAPLAQSYFDQGVRLVFAFNHEEAINSFEEASWLDPEAPMPYWGIALALGPNINLPMGEQEGRRAYEAVQKATALSAKASPKERAYIDALVARYSPSAEVDRKQLDQAYAEAMGAVWAQYPDDANAGTLYAEALMDLQPWHYWTPEGEPIGRAKDIVATLERVLVIKPDHPGACHYYIHAVEASQRPERALPCAERLPTLMPGAGHLVHMPAHIYLRLGMYEKAAERNVHAVAADHELLAHRALEGVYPHGYYPHNLHFLWAALTMEGRSTEAIKAAQDLSSLAPWEAARTEPSLEEFTPTLLFAYVRFGKWNEVLSVPKPPAELLHTTAVWHYARGLAFTRTQRVDQATHELEALSNLIKEIPGDRMVGISPVAELAKIAREILAGEVATQEGLVEDALAHFNKAVQVEDALRYYEPPLWQNPARLSLGALLLKVGRASDAEQVYRTDLRQHPHNGWALFGLAQSLRAQGRSEEAATVDQQFHTAWARADVDLSSSRF